MHSKHELSYAKPTTGHYSSYQGLLLIAHKNISNAFWTMFKKRKEKEKTLLTR